ncbi:unnamed protein product [Rhizoctonia solani]|uniref:Uncharacterized protein n=1 Tax=Rhizoctonia solani TaxID=456999 RepID=A0A8H2XPQ8_9AGAM|nr:unnamed protein product [Rhizoctonia solani]
MNVMDIMSSCPFGGRKRSWGEEQCEPPKKRTSYTWIRDRPPAAELDYPIIRQVQNIALGTHPEQNDVQMIMDEPEPMFFPLSPVSRSTSPPVTRNDPATTLLEISTQLIATGTAPDSARSSDLARVGSSTKKRFAIGPRADCRKCLAREPGHYGHWL